MAVRGLTRNHKIVIEITHSSEAKANAERAENQYRGAGPAGRGEKHADNHCEDDEHDDARFRQGQVIAPGGGHFYARVYFNVHRQ